MPQATAKPAQRVDRKPMRRARRRTTDLRVVTDHVVWTAHDRADEGDMLTFRGCDRWMNDPSIWEDMEEARCQK
jgi:hypothetical protein